MLRFLAKCMASLGGPQVSRFWYQFVVLAPVRSATNLTAQVLEVPTGGTHIDHKIPVECGHSSPVWALLRTKRLRTKHLSVVPATLALHSLGMTSV